VYASSSSVYGAGAKAPFREDDNTDQPMSFYGATKKSNELAAFSYAHLHGLNITGLRFFTVYGPWGRPDMAMWLFAAAILKGQPIKLFNGGNMRRDFTYVDDVAIAVVKLIDHVARGNAAWSGDDPDPATSRAPWCVYNIGNHTAVDLMEVVHLLETSLGKKAIRELMPMQPGDVRETCADVEDLQKAVGFAPNTPIAVGIQKFVDWFRAFHGV
jgi:UDP-glucuronate 4-epimerase